MTGELAGQLAQLQIHRIIRRAEAELTVDHLDAKLTGSAIEAAR